MQHQVRTNVFPAQHSLKRRLMKLYVHWSAMTQVLPQIPDNFVAKQDYGREIIEIIRSELPQQKATSPPAGGTNASQKVWPRGGKQDGSPARVSRPLSIC